MIELNIITYQLLLRKYTDYRYQIDYIIENNGIDYADIVWVSKDFEKPSKEELDDKIKFYQKIEDIESIVNKRKLEYPSPEEWIVALVQKEVDGQEEEWNRLVEKRNSIKQKFLK